jgi:hypothetical protein
MGPRSGQRHLCKHLRKYGFLPPTNSGVDVVNLGLVPCNLDTEELEGHLLENGAMICGLRTSGGDYGSTTTEAKK